MVKISCLYHQLKYFLIKPLHYLSIHVYLVTVNYMSSPLKSLDITTCKLFSFKHESEVAILSCCQSDKKNPEQSIPEFDV